MHEPLHSHTNQPQVSIIIVTHNSLPALKDCLRAIPDAANGVAYEVLVVDNDSADGSPDTAEKHEHTTVVQQERNSGFAAACNRGAEDATGNYLLFLNPDLRMDPGTVRGLLDVAVGHDKAGLVTGRLRFPDGTFQATCRQLPTPRNLVYSRGSALSRWFGRSSSGTTTSYTLPDYDRVTKVPAVAAALVMIRRELFDELGGFDKRFFLYMEDTDLSVRVSQAGYVNLFVPEAGGVHLLGEGSDISHFTRRRRQAMAVWRYFLKHYPNGFSVILLPVMLTLNLILLSLLPPKKPRVSS